MSTEAPRPAGLWVRCAAFGFDDLLITAYLNPLVLAGALLNYFSGAQFLFGGPYRGQACGFLRDGASAGWVCSSRISMDGG